MPFFKRTRPVLDGLKLVWTGLAIWFEYVVFIYSVRKCSWPDSDIQARTDSSFPQPTHVLLVADPQILDHRSYPDRAPSLTWISQLLVDLNLRKSWRAALRTRPDIVIFLGDMMDGGRFAMTDGEYERYYRRFKSIFPLDSSVPQYFIPGNHDTGLGIYEEFSGQAGARYTSHFGPLNSLVTIANHTVVFLDAPGLVEEDFQRHSVYDRESNPGGPIELVRSFAKSQDQYPVILLTHIPLSRPDRADCGPNRERGTIRRGTGFGYQNTLGKSASDFLLQSLRPSVIFSGDDHDYCEYTHSYDSAGKPRRAREVTVKSLSMAMGIRRPGFQLLSLVPPHSMQGSSSHADSLCLLPDQLGIYLSTYIPFLVLSLIVIFIVNIRRVSSPRKNRRSSNSGSATSPSYALRSRSDTGRTEPSDWLQYSSESDGDILPRPTSSSSKKVSRPIYSHTFVLLGRRRRITINVEAINSFARTIFVCCGNQEVPKTRGFAMGVLYDVRDVAVFPFTIFAFLSWWVFR
ncbi:Metallo-dependent phosphatase-like protein [Mycena alexandri]|uniref:Metallo-dependent phosphatase-like protein n=1 Tax=Mycena alexandri TaxID=1745969 RepID=A0AAD6TGJ1_9AGAR|nr:Metallo-dependent phosphatase-like protein [Mycena alexandri]